MGMVEAGTGFCVLGNHDAKFLRWLNGRNVKPTHGLDRTIAQMEAESPEFRQQREKIRRRLDLATSGSTAAGSSSPMPASEKR